MVDHLQQCISKGRTINHCGGVSGRDFDLAFFFLANKALAFFFLGQEAFHSRRKNIWEASVPEKNILFTDLPPPLPRSLMVDPVLFLLTFLTNKVIILTSIGQVFVLDETISSTPHLLTIRSSLQIIINAQIKQTKYWRFWWKAWNDDPLCDQPTLDELFWNLMKFTLWKWNWETCKVLMENLHRCTWKLRKDVEEGIHKILTWEN